MFEMRGLLDTKGDGPFWYTLTHGTSDFRTFTMTKQLEIS